jgi:hypothetical protein
MHHKYLCVWTRQHLHVPTIFNRITIFPENYMHLAVSLITYQTNVQGSKNFLGPSCLSDSQILCFPVHFSVRSWLLSASSTSPLKSDRTTRYILGGWKTTPSAPVGPHSSEISIEWIIRTVNYDPCYTYTGKNFYEKSI